MPAVGRTYWLTEPCRIRREDNSLRIERPDNTPVRIPITDVRDLIAFDHVDINTSALSILSRNGVSLHVLDHYGNHAGHFAPTDAMSSGPVLRRQVELTADPDLRATIGRALILAAGENLRWSLDTDHLAPALATLRAKLPSCDERDAIMAQEGNYRRTGWAVLDTQLPPWLRLNGRTRRPPTNAGNAFISYLNTLVYARVLTAIRSTPLHPAIGFLHADTDRRRNTLALDLAEPFKPLFAERLLKRAASQKHLKPSDFETEVGRASLSKSGRKKVAVLMREELDTTVYHRTLKRKVSYEEIIHLEALKIVRLCLEDKPYKPFRPWW
ncbi:type I-B CRISPR-associated endonuclease Cas1b [Streptomyces sp. NBRC 109706]|uniref:type I-B CRISPR-associated endonuclease Cas1b n=1 Tax=Streptomyces sp. NBRC 109706 TaxID=1550035 RepID=UPI00078433B5|nr:type I-B CRISPR-associated endonuclease Cas1b [Streptomyces sp. NBRC 109706]